MARMKYCPNCGVEYREGFERCDECDVALVDQPPQQAEREESSAREDPHSWSVAPREEVLKTGRRIDAELVRGRLEADGIDARIWAGGVGVWRLESALTEVTGIPNDFNAYRVTVPASDVERAREILSEEPALDQVSERDLDHKDDHVGSLWVMRSRWLLIGFAIFFLLLILVFGPPGVDV